MQKKCVFLILFLIIFMNVFAVNSISPPASMAERLVMHRLEQFGRLFCSERCHVLNEARYRRSVASGQLLGTARRAASLPLGVRAATWSAAARVRVGDALSARRLCQVRGPVRGERAALERRKDPPARAATSSTSWSHSARTTTERAAGAHTETIMNRPRFTTSAAGLWPPSARRARRRALKREGLAPPGSRDSFGCKAASSQATPPPRCRADERLTR